MRRRSRITKLATWTCLLGILFVAVTDWTAQALPPSVELLLGRPGPLLVPRDGRLVPAPPQSPALAVRKDRAPPSR